jgi:hypothetical protein
MSRSCRLGITAVFLAGFAVLATLFVVGHVEGAKPAPAIPLQASFEESWVTDENQNEVNLYRMQNDVTGLPYVDTPDVKVGKKVVKSGVEVKYYPPGGSDQIGRFKMIIDQAGSLQRFVRLHFLEPSTDPALDESAYPGFPVDPLWGGTGTLLTSRISIMTWGVLKKDDNGILKPDPDYPPLDMDKMQTNTSKYIWLGIDFNPAGEFIDRTYHLGLLAGVSLTGAAELFCVQAGQVWEIRPFTESFGNEPDNSWRILYTNVQMDFLRMIKLRSWHMPFVLRVWKP